jgi:hypothetical protein
VAAAASVELTCLAVEVTLELSGRPLIATAARMTVQAAAAEGVDVAAIIARAKAESTVSNSLARGFPVEVAAA